MNRESLQQFQKMIDSHSRIVFFGGAGVSVASGIPDFRSADGLYNNRGVEFENYEPEYLLSRTCLYREPKVFYEFYRQKLDTRGVEPNVTHYKLAELERAGKMVGIVTQNIDGLHQRAGSERVFEIHGTTMRNYCHACGRVFPGDYIFKYFDGLTPESGPDAIIPRCDKCGGMVRPAVTLYEESLPEDAVRGAIDAIASADMMIIAGTSLVVYPAAGMVDYFHGDTIVLIDKGVTSRDRYADLVIRDPMEDVFSEIVVR